MEEEYVPQALKDERREDVERAAKVRFCSGAWLVCR